MNARWHYDRWILRAGYRRVGLALVCLVLVGCGKSIERQYGQRHGPGATASVNGTAVLAEMFEQSGDKVFSTRWLSPRIERRADCIVWFPDNFTPPAADVRLWLETWLEAAPGRTLVYVGRDFDAAPWYWQKVTPMAPAEQKTQVRERLVETKSAFRTARSVIPATEDCQWFTVEGQYKPRSVRSLKGEPEWLDQVDPAKLEIELVSRMLPSADAQVLLQSESDMLITREPWYGSQLIVVANGSFLLNLPLVNHEHRKLAGKLIDAAGPPGQTVVFLESGSMGPRISETDPILNIPTGLEIFHEFPAAWILLHLAAAGVVFCFWRFPIFGRPKDVSPKDLSDFGQHIGALAGLLKRTQDRVFAREQWLHYQQTTKGGQ